MPPLASDLRRQLETVVVQARDLTEASARAALKRWAVDVAKPFDHFSAADKSFRSRLRARGKQAGDRRDEKRDTQEIDQLTEELAYEYWHRMLFARFLAENNLLMHPDGVAVTLAECDELAAPEKAANGFVLAARFASRMLPEIFRIDDVLLEVEFPINDRLPLERLLASLPTQVFTADDSLGWVYQFWQSKKKDEVNKSGQKIDGRTLSAVTQLFTEHYMVEFLLHNTIGAWWAAKEGISPRMKHATLRVPDTDGKPEYLNGIDPCSIRVSSVALPSFDYLRWRDDGTPAAGKFEGWPKTLSEFTMLDPCCGSGHFLVAAFNLLVPLRMHDEKLTAEQACEAVLKDNLFGLELDPRCTQIAAFALALAAWKYPDAGGYRRLPALNIACSGQGVVGSKADWVKFANGDKNFTAALGFLYDEFEKAPTLGSLINPRAIAESIFQTGFAPLRGSLDRALRKMENQADPDRAAVGVAAQGIAVAASLMARQFTLVATNVPYLARGKQDETMRKYLGDVHSAAKADLATAFVERCLEYCAEGGSTALVTPQNWLFLGSYKGLREWLLRQATWNLVAKLGPAAFDDMNWCAANTMLTVLTVAEPGTGHEIVGLEASGEKGAAKKSRLLLSSLVTTSSQSDQLLNREARIIFADYLQKVLLREYATALSGCSAGDSPRFIRGFWETVLPNTDWEYHQSTVTDMCSYGGRSEIIYWQNERGEMWQLAESVKHLNHAAQNWLRGKPNWGKQGVVVSQMGSLPATIYSGDRYDCNCCAIVPNDVAHLAALWAYCASGEYRLEVRKLNQKVNVTPGTLLDVPFDLGYWQAIAAQEYSNGLPEPHSDDPTQWLFKGHPNGSTDPLQVAVARLLGYRWPDQEPDELDALGDNDGIVPIPSVRGEPPAAERLLELVQRAVVGRIGNPSTIAADGIASTDVGRIANPSYIYERLAEAGCRPGTSLDDWLRNSFFEQHCKRFHNRPFVWHLWDGRKDGFACLVNYHKLDHTLLETLTYSYLQDWITAQAAAAKSSQTGADLRLAAAQAMQDKLKLILAGEPPFDIFVRWKPLAQQPIGWNPDLNDGVRLNIRPFMTAGILRKNPNIKWTKDRGKEPERDKDEYPWFWSGASFVGDRVNDVHLTHAQKKAARDKAGSG
jgi:N-6 DNA Methylase